MGDVASRRLPHRPEGGELSPASVSREPARLVSARVFEMRWSRLRSLRGRDAGIAAVAVVLAVATLSVAASVLPGQSALRAAVASPARAMAVTTSASSGSWTAFSFVHPRHALHDRGPEPRASGSLRGPVSVDPRVASAAGKSAGHPELSAVTKHMNIPRTSSSRHGMG